MFYCEACRLRNGWPESFCRSRGLCEMCDAPAVCYDVPSSRLPDTPRSDQRVSDVPRMEAEPKS